LGLRKVIEHANLAYNASWHESRVQCGEVWIPPPEVSVLLMEPPLAQNIASFKFDQAMLNSLVNKATSEREVQRLLRLATPHAGAFITAVPAQEQDGKDTILNPRLFRCAIAYRLGIPLLDRDDSPCPFCEQPINKFGDHATCCRKSGDIITRHNNIRNFIHSIACDGLLSPVLEKKGILGETSGRRPGDVTIPIWSLRAKVYALMSQ
jgi:hypothetical protein